MFHPAAEQRSLDEVAITLLEQLGCCGGVCPETTPLPSVESVMSVVHDIRELLFPGVHGNRRFSPGSAVSEYVASLNRIQSRLRIEISRALVHSRQIQLKLHNGVDAVSLAPSASALTDRFLSRLPELQRILNSDVETAFNGDPAAKTRDEIVLCYPGIEAITVYRIAHELLTLGVPYLPRIMTEWAHRETGIDIHPGAKIGAALFIDHGTGVVIGETCEIGSGVTLYQGVTLGAWSFPRDEDGNLIRGTKRHPTLEDRVTVYSNATILGGTTIIGAGSQVGSSVTLSRSIPPNTIVTIEKPSLRFREAA
jgi:serine O-acetyltransferase